MAAADYDGYRHVFPMRNRNNMVHPYKGEAGEYSHWDIWADVQPLQAAPLNDVTPGEGDRPGDVRMSQEFTGKFGDVSVYKAMEGNFGPESAPDRRFTPTKFHGVPAAVIFGDDYGHDGTRETNYSNFVQIGGLGANDPLDDAGHAARGYGEAYAGYGPTKPHLHQGADSVKALENPDDGEPAPDGFYGGVRVHNGVPSSKAL